MLKMIRIESRQPPSFLWALTEDQRRHHIAKKDAQGKPLWTIETLTEDQAFYRPFVLPDEAEAAWLELHAELNEDPVTAECMICKTRMKPCRAKQKCERCYEAGERVGLKAVAA